MTIFASTSDKMAREGPSLDVQIDLPPTEVLWLKKEPPKVSAYALIDTGASMSCIDQSIAQKLGLIPRDIQTVLTPNGRCEQPLYDILLSIPDIKREFLLEVLGSTLGDQIHHVLIGRDLLRQTTLIYSGLQDRFEICI